MPRGEPVLTLRQPWASAIFDAGKDVENRTWRTPYRGRLWIHAGLSRRARIDAYDWAGEEDVWVPEEPLPRGVILGCVDLVDCVEESDSVWALPGNVYWLVRRPRRLVRPVPFTGGLGLSYRRPPRGELVRARRSRKSLR